jgi:hypothetical protein
MKNFRQLKIIAIICIFSILFITGISTAQNSDRVTTPESEVFISSTQFIFMSLFLLQMAFFIILVRVLVGGSGGY